MEGRCLRCGLTHDHRAEVDGGRSERLRLLGSRSGRGSAQRNRERTGWIVKITRGVSRGAGAPVDCGENVKRSPYRPSQRRRENAVAVVALGEVGAIGQGGLYQVNTFGGSVVEGRGHGSACGTDAGGGKRKRGRGQRQRIVGLEWRSPMKTVSSAPVLDAQLAQLKVW